MQRNVTDGVIFAVAIAIAIATTGCESKSVTRVSDEAVAPNAPKWQRATVSMTYERGHGNYPARLRYSARVSGAGGEQNGTLEQVYGPSGIANAPMEVSKEELETLRKKTPRVQLAPDGHALVYSRDGGPRYRFVALDAGDKPVFCAHLVFDADASGNALAAAPTTRDLALAVLRTRENKGQPHYPSYDGAWSIAFEAEALGAVAYACAHRDDAELRAAVAAAAKQMPAFATTVVTDALAACAARLSAPR